MEGRLDLAALILSENLVHRPARGNVGQILISEAARAIWIPQGRVAIGIIAPQIPDLPSPLKSPVPTISQLVGTLARFSSVKPPEPFGFHKAVLPLESLRHKSLICRRR